MDSGGQGLPETSSSASASGDLVLHSVSGPAFLVQRELLCQAQSLGLKTERASSDRCQLWS